MEKFYPLFLSGVTKSPLWGGTRLPCEWNKCSPDGGIVGESWELTVRKKEMSTVTNGTLAGTSVDELLQEHPSELMGKSTVANGEFPLLIKLIDAADRLSVQVHPDDAYAARVENDRGKTEMWYIVEADEGAEIIYGLKDGISAEDFRTAVREGRLADTMHHCPVKAGETYFIPSGMLHAIGAGILIAEIQQNCDLTYRVYDYERRGADGSLRELHVDKALDVTIPFTEEAVRAIRYEAGEQNDETLAHCRYFKTRKLTVTEPTTLNVNDESFAYALCIGGQGTLTYQGESYPLLTADGYFLPAGLGEVVLEGDMTVLMASIQ